MSGARRLMRGALVLLVGQGGGQLLGLVRNFAVARLVAPEDFGVAVAFAALLSMLEAASDMAWDKLLIQARDGEDSDLMESIHALTVIRGALLALLLWVAAAPLAALFDVPEAADAFAWLALIPLLRGLIHMDVKRLQRDLRFGPEVQATLLSHLVGMIVAVWLAWTLGDYRAMLWGLVAQSLTLMAASHALAERRYRLGLRAARIRQIFAFGWPLLLNGLVIVASAQGDRLLVGAEIGVRELALYAAAAMLFEAARTMISKVFGNLALPWLAAAQAEHSLLARRYLLFAAAMAGAAILCFLPLILVGAQMVAVIFGAAYLAPQSLIAALAFASAIRFLRGGVTVTALALGDSKSVLIVNVVRLVGLAAAALWLAEGGGVVGVAVAMAVGEALAFAAALHRLGRFPALPTRRGAALLLLPFAVLGGATAAAAAIDVYAAPFWFAGGALAGTAGAAVVIFALCPPLRDALQRLRRGMARE